MTQSTYQRGKAPWTVQCEPKCESDGATNGKKRRREIKAAWYKMHKGQTMGIDFNDRSTWPPLSQFTCHRCGLDHSGQAKTQPAKVKAVQVAQVETAPQTDQPFDALQFLIECRDFKRGKWLTKHNGERVHVKGTAARHLREQNGMGKDASIEMVKQLSRQVECMAKKPVETKEDAAVQTLKFIQRISPPQIKPAPKTQAKPAPQADGSVEVVSPDLFYKMVDLFDVEFECVYTATIDGKVIQCVAE